MNCFREYIKYVTLNVLGMIGLSCYILADTFFVAQGLGSSGLAALNLAIPIYSFIHGVGLMLGIGGASRYSMQRGQDQGTDADRQKRQKNLAEDMKHTKQNAGRQDSQSDRNFAHTSRQSQQSDRIFTHTIILGACFAVIFVLAGLFGSGMLTRLLGADTEVFEMCETYLKVMLLFSPAILLNDIILCFVRNDGAPQLSMAAMLTGSISNIILDFVFIFIFDMGIFGAVFATGLAPVISLMVMLRFFVQKRNQFKIAKCRPCAQLVQHIFAGGIPSLVAEVSSGIVMMIFNIVMLKLRGNIGVAAYGVVANLSLVVLAVYTGGCAGNSAIDQQVFWSWKCGKNTQKFPLCGMDGDNFVGRDLLWHVFRC